MEIQLSIKSKNFRNLLVYVKEKSYDRVLRL